MQITFDPRDPSQLAMVAAIIDHASGGNAGSVAADACATAPAADDDARAAFEQPTRAEPVAPQGDASDADDDSDTGNATAAAAPSATPATTAPAAPAAPPEGVTTDSNGLPWDKRIHAGKEDNKITNADGSWRRRRGVSDELVAQVEAELKQVMSATGEPAAPAGSTAPSASAPAPAPTSAPVPAPPAGNAEPSAAPATPPVPAAPAPTAAPAAPVPTPPAAPAAAAGQGDAIAAPADTPQTFATVMRRTTEAQTAGKLTIEQTNQIALSLGLTGVRDLLQRPDLVPQYSERLAQYEQAGA